MKQSLGLQRGTVRLEPYNHEWRRLFEKKYQNLKEKLFDAHAGNREPYTKGKEEFVRKILKLAGYKGKIL